MDTVNCWDNKSKMLGDTCNLQRLASHPRAENVRSHAFHTTESGVN